MHMRKTTLTYRTTGDELEALRRIAESTKRTISSLIEEGMAEAVKSSRDLRPRAKGEVKYTSFTCETTLAKRFYNLRASQKVSSDRALDAIIQHLAERYAQ